MSTVERLTAGLSDRYRVTRELGAGGMATVYLAHDLKHDRDVAIKVLKPELGAVLGADRFLSEIKVTANLQHPHLLPLFDSGEADGLLYYVMPFIEGETLRARLQREQQLPVDETVRLVTSIAGALDFAHARGVLMRMTTGLNPSLISLSADGRQLAYSVATYQTGFWKVRVPERGLVSSRAALPVSSDRQTVEALDISRDGRWLVFDSDRDGIQQIFRMPRDGGAVQAVTSDSNPKFKPMVSPDGRDVAYHAVQRGRRRVFVTSIDGGTPTTVSAGTDPDERNASWSPDGQRVAWVVPTAAYYAPTQVGQYRVQWSARDAKGQWSAPTTVPFNGRILTLGWTDGGASLIGIDSAWHFVTQPIAGGPARRVGGDVTIDSTMLPSGIPATSSDGKTLYLLQRAQYLTADASRPQTVLSYRLADGAYRIVLTFDERARPHSNASNGLAEYNGWLYFTLSDFQSDIWVATVTGLTR